MASSCIPGIFIPVEIGSRLLVDGGLVENVPISPLKEMGAEMIMGVDINAKRKYQKPDDIIDVLSNALDLAIDNATRIQTEGADVLITPKLSAYNRADVEMVHDLVKEGYDADLTVIDMNLEKEVIADELFSKTKWSPFEGKTLQGWPITTIVNGKIVYHGDEIIKHKAKEVIFNDI